MSEATEKPQPTDAVSNALDAARPAIERICAEVWDLAEPSL